LIKFLKEAYLVKGSNLIILSSNMKRLAFLHLSKFSKINK
jgi:hypothetical protein